MHHYSHTGHWKLCNCSLSAVLWSKSSRWSNKKVKKTNSKVWYSPAVDLLFRGRLIIVVNLIVKLQKLCLAVLKEITEDISLCVPPPRPNNPGIVQQRPDGQYPQTPDGTWGRGGSFHQWVKLMLVTFLQLSLDASAPSKLRVSSCIVTPVASPPTSAPPQPGNDASHPPVTCASSTKGQTLYSFDL